MEAIIDLIELILFERISIYLQAYINSKWRKRLERMNNKKKKLHPGPT